MKSLSLASSAVTMSSLEIAEITGKRHDNVRRTIESLAESSVIQLPQFEGVKNQLGQSIKSYLIGKRDSYVIVAQLSPEFTGKLVDRWQELEAKTPILPTTYLEALQALVVCEKARGRSSTHQGRDWLRT